MNAHGMRGSPPLVTVLVSWFQIEYVQTEVLKFVVASCSPCCSFLVVFFPLRNCRAICGCAASLTVSYYTFTKLTYEVSSYVSIDASKKVALVANEMKILSCSLHYIMTNIEAWITVHIILLPDQLQVVASMWFYYLEFLRGKDVQSSWIDMFVFFFLRSSWDVREKGLRECT